MSGRHVLTLPIDNDLIPVGTSSTKTVNNSENQVSAKKKNYIFIIYIFQKREDLFS